MAEIVLDALIGSHPLGALASFGLLRCCEHMPVTPDPRLAWQFDGDWVAVLHVAGECSREQLVSALVERQHARSEAPFLTWSDDIKVPPSDFRKQLLAARASATPSQREVADFFAAFGSEHVTDKTAKRNVKPTAFHMTAGQQKFLKSARELAESLDPSVLASRRQSADQRQQQCEEAFSEALFGPWRYRDSEHALGWDPSTEALHALSAVAPTVAGPSSVRAAVWLAFEALPLFPCFAQGRKLVTTGFDAEGDWLTWPLSSVPVSLRTLRSLLGLSMEETGSLTARGVVVTYRARRSTDPNGRGTLRPAILAR